MLSPSPSDPATPTIQGDGMLSRFLPKHFPTAQTLIVPVAPCAKNVGRNDITPAPFQGSMDRAEESALGRAVNPCFSHLPADQRATLTHLERRALERGDDGSRPALLAECQPPPSGAVREGHSRRPEVPGGLEGIYPVKGNESRGLSVRR